MTCINSTLIFLVKLARTNSQLCIVTFELLLFWKNSNIINISSDSFFDDTIVILGAFHTIMNLLGCIVYIMMKSTFNNLSETIYGTNTLVQIFIGNTHSLVDQALPEILLEFNFCQNYFFQRNVFVSS